MIRRIAAAGALAAAVTLTGLTAGQAAAVQAPGAPVPVGPECAPNVVGAVLTALAQNGVQLPPGTKVQYLQVTQNAAGTYYVQPCVVTVP